MSGPRRRVRRRVVEVLDWIAIRVLSRRLVNRRRGMVRLGSSYGGWWVPQRVLDDTAVAYCIGAGEDISFDLELLANGLTVRTFDPTPRASSYVDSLNIRSESFSFVPVALWSGDVTLRLYAPRDPAHVSHSALNLQGTDEFLELPAITLATAISRFKDSHIDLLKLDIEGAEVEVIPGIAAMSDPPSVLCIEFDAARPYRRLLGLVRSLRSGGYRTVRCDRRNVVMLLRGRRRSRGRQQRGSDE